MNGSAYVQLKRKCNAAQPFMRERHMPFSTRETISLIEVEDYTEIVQFLPKGKLIKSLYNLNFLKLFFLKIKQK